ncbi:MAG: phosphate ABC transporter permease subunit PstC [Chloroflexales bacterium]
MRLRQGILAQAIFFSAAAVVALSTAALLLFTGSRGLAVFGFMSPGEFFLGTSWDQNDQAFGVLPLLLGSLLTVGLTLLISGPMALGVAIFMVEIAPASVRRGMRTVVELFAALPSVIYGLLGLTLVVPWVREISGGGLGKGVMAAVIVLVFMTQPTIVSIAEDALRALPEALREGALAIGATRWQMIWRVLLPAARPGLITAVVLGTGRAVGETIAVQMVIGNITSRLPDSLVKGATTMPSAIVTQLPEATSPEHRAALIMVAFLLLLITFGLIAAVRAAGSRGQTRQRSRRPTPVAQPTVAKGGD